MCNVCLWDCWIYNSSVLQITCPVSFRTGLYELVARTIESRVAEYFLTDICEEETRKGAKQV